MKQNITTPLTSYEILSGIDRDSSNEEYFYLIGYSNDKDIKVSRILILDKGIFHTE
jgi:hypothetical protein